MTFQDSDSNSENEEVEDLEDIEIPEAPVTNQPRLSLKPNIVNKF